MTQQTPSRRSILRSAAATAAFTIIPSGLVRGFAANEKVNVAVIGAGGQGAVNRLWLKNDGANIVSVCDCDLQHAREALKDHPGAQIWADYREMLEKQKEIDAVMVSTPDHTHFPASMLAMKLGKHCCTEKPLTHSVWEARQLALAAREYKVATQLDNEGHASDGLRRTVEWIRAGAVGKVHEVHIWTDRPIWPQGIAQRLPRLPVPKDLNWDLWIGAAPYRDYHDDLHPFKWRGWWDFGTGALGDMGCHFFDSPFWALELGQPTRVEAISGGNSAETGPNWSVVTYQFPARSAERPAVTLKWFDGRKEGKQNLPPRPEELAADARFPTNGTLFIGEKGKLLVADTSSPRLIPEEKMKAFHRPAPFSIIPRSIGHKKEWLQAIKGGPPASSNFTDYGGPLAEVVLLGNLAVRTGRPLEWDSKSLSSPNCPEAAPLIRRAYRKGWEV